MKTDLYSTSANISANIPINLIGSFNYSKWSQTSTTSSDWKVKRGRRRGWRMMGGQKEEKRKKKSLRTAGDLFNKAPRYISSYLLRCFTLRFNHLLLICYIGGLFQYGPEHLQNLPSSKQFVSWGKHVDSKKSACQTNSAQTNCQAVSSSLVSFSFALCWGVMTTCDELWPPSLCV